MKSNKTTLILQKGDTKYKLLKIIFGNDGAYYITAPYHTQKKAFLFKTEVDYQKLEQKISTDGMIETATLDDDELNLKISHHPDGFLQFSGNGIISGKHPDGTPKGIGIQSWPLSVPVRGPAFGVVIKNYQDVIKTTESSVDQLCVNYEMVSANENDANTFVEGFFFPKQSEHFIYRENNQEYISLAHPMGMVLKLHVVRPKQISEYFGFIGLHIYVQTWDDKYGDYEYIFSTSSGNVVKDDKNRILKGTCLYAMYPNPDNQKLPSLNWPPKSTTL